MFKQSRFVAFAVLFGMLFLSSVPALAQIDSFFDVFYLELGGDKDNWNALTSGGGSGYGNGEWYEYKGEFAEPSQTDPWGNTNPVPTWLNEWFYDGNYRPERYKVVELDFSYALTDPAQNGGTDIVINWTTPEWSELGLDNPPLGFTDNQYIGRAVLTNVCWLEAGDEGIYHFSGVFDLREYGVPFNPEWVSIDVTGYNVQLSSSTLPGSINHHCIPEPGTLALLATAGLGLILFVWRRRN